VVTIAYRRLPEAVDIYRLLEAPDRRASAVWRTPDVVWFYNDELNAIGLLSLRAALEVVEASAASMHRCTRPGTITA
jgi:hypothetical protein